MQDNNKLRFDSLQQTHKLRFDSLQPVQKSQWYTTKEAADILNISDRTVQRECKKLRKGKNCRFFDEIKEVKSNKGRGGIMYEVKIKKILLKNTENAQEKYNYLKKIQTEKNTNDNLTNDKKFTNDKIQTTEKEEVIGNILIKNNITNDKNINKITQNNEIEQKSQAKYNSETPPELYFSPLKMLPEKYPKKENSTTQKTEEIPNIVMDNIQAQQKEIFEAAKLVYQGKTSAKQAAKLYNIPKSTLYSAVKRIKKRGLNNYFQKRADTGERRWVGTVTDYNKLVTNFTKWMHENFPEYEHYLKEYWQVMIEKTNKKVVMRKYFEDWLLEDKKVNHHMPMPGYKKRRPHEQKL